MDHGAVQQPGFLGRLFGRKPSIVRDADLEAATSRLPEGARVVQSDPRGNWVVYEQPGGAQRVRFRASEAWLPNEPSLTLNNTLVTSATIDPTGRVVVTEGLHRTRAVARNRVFLPLRLGGVEHAPGWLDFLHEPTALHDTPSTRAIAQLLGGDLDAPFIPAR